MKVGDKVEIFSFRSNKLLKGTIALVDPVKDIVSVHTKTIVYDFDFSFLHKKSGPANPEYIIYTLNGVAPTIFSFEYANARTTASSILIAQSNGVRMPSPTENTKRSGAKVIHATQVQAGVCTCPMRELLMRGCSCSEGRASLERERNKSY